MVNKEAALKVKAGYEKDTKKITKMKFCIMSNYAYMQMKGHLQNFALDYRD